MAASAHTCVRYVHNCVSKLWPTRVGVGIFIPASGYNSVHNCLSEMLDFRNCVSVLVFVCFCVHI